MDKSILTFSQAGQLKDNYFQAEQQSYNLTNAMKKIEKMCKNMRLIVSDLQTLDVNFSDDITEIESQKDFDKGYIQAVRDILQKLYDLDK